MTRVSVVMPALNERSTIRRCIDSLLAQDHHGIDEILVVDGGSSDGTRELVEALGGPVRLVDNPRVTAAAAMNVGLAAARNDVIVRVDAHTRYAADYVSRSLEALESSGADWVGGPMRPEADTPFGEAVTAVTTSPFGVGPGRFHYSEAAEDVDTVYLGTFDRRIVAEVGGYDEDSIQWAAEDQELAFRLRRAGRRIRLDPSIRSWYRPRSTPSALWRQYFNYGMCKASTLAKHRTLPTWRPLAPAALILWIVGGALLPRRAAAAPATAYLLVSGAVAVRLAHRSRQAPHRVAGAMWICHVAYGLGFWNGIGRILRGAQFDSGRVNSKSPHA